MVDELLEYILANRKGKAFPYQPDIIRTILCNCIIFNTLAYAVNDNGKVIGVVCCRKNEAKKKLFVDDILTTEPSALPVFIRIFTQTYPDYEIEGTTATGKFRTYNTSKLVRRLLRKGI